MKDVSFCKQMRKSTRDIHAISDQLVNLKLAFALHDNSVWAEGLLVFYEVFRWLELNVDILRDSAILPTQLLRTEAFEEDLAYYLGKDWKIGYVPREEVADYLNCLECIKAENPTFLLAYCYHLYMGLLSGGQILQKKRQLFSSTNEGMAVTKFSDYTISDLKSKIRLTFEDFALTWDNETKDRILSEGRNVFKMNNKIIGSVKNVDKVNMRQLGYIVLAVLIIVVSIYMWNL